MHETLEVLNVMIGPRAQQWILAMPVGVGAVVALSPEAARKGHEEGWLEGYRPPQEESALRQARQTQDEAQIQPPTPIRLHSDAQLPPPDAQPEGD